LDDSKKYFQEKFYFPNFVTQQQQQQQQQQSDKTQNVIV
jgi:hypothetical protein